MNVLENVCYGLKIRRMARDEREKLGREALALVKLAGMEARKPAASRRAANGSASRWRGRWSSG